MSDPKDPTLLILGGSRRPRGRPPVDEPRALASAWMPVTEYDALITLARKRGESISATLRFATRLVIKRAE